VRARFHRGRDDDPPFDMVPRNKMRRFHLCMGGAPAVRLSSPRITEGASREGQAVDHCSGDAT
jgi:hypothetical protein